MAELVATAEVWEMLVKGVSHIGTLVAVQGLSRSGDTAKARVLVKSNRDREFVTFLIEVRQSGAVVILESVTHGLGGNEVEAYQKFLEKGERT